MISLSIPLERIAPGVWSELPQECGANCPNGHGPDLLQGSREAGWAYTRAIPRMPTFWLLGRVIETSVLPAGIW